MVWETRSWLMGCNDKLCMYVSTLRRKIHLGNYTILYRVCCIEYTLGCLWTHNAMLYCVFRTPNVFFFLAFKRFDGTKPIQLLNTYEKSISDFDMKIINNKHTLLYNRPIIHSIQRYNGLCELTNCRRRKKKKLDRILKKID